MSFYQKVYKIKKKNNRLQKTEILPMTRAQSEFAMKVTEKMMSYPISFFFISQNNFEKVLKIEKLSKIKLFSTLYFNTIKANLQQNQYKTIEDWKKDVMRLFDNSSACFPQSSPFTQIIIELKKKFLAKIQKQPITDTDLWTLQMQKANKKLQNISQKLLSQNDLSQNTEPIEKTPTKIILRKKQV